MTLKPQVSNQYPKNRATFSPTNELVLSDGVLWDVNSGKEIHKLDKLNQTISGVFHPNGLEIVANTEVWDLRTFHLLRTVPTLDQCELVFSPDGAAIYTLSIEQENDDSKDAFESSFRTLDAYDYSPIATIDVKKNIHYIACNKFDTQIAIVENVGMFDNIQESSVRVYDVGRRRDDDDEPVSFIYHAAVLYASTSFHGRFVVHLSNLTIIYYRRKKRKMKKMTKWTVVMMGHRMII